MGVVQTLERLGNQIDRQRQETTPALADDFSACRRSRPSMSSIAR